VARVGHFSAHRLRPSSSAWHLAASALAAQAKAVMITGTDQKTEFTATAGMSTSKLVDEWLNSSKPVLVRAKFR
jgi:hypothetical protein